MCCDAVTAVSCAVVSAIRQVYGYVNGKTADSPGSQYHTGAGWIRLICGERRDNEIKPAERVLSRYISDKAFARVTADFT